MFERTLSEWLSWFANKKEDRDNSGETHTVITASPTQSTEVSDESGSLNGGTQSKRLLSIDALRGFDMLLISGGALFLLRMNGLTDSSVINWLAAQLRHAAWHGFTFYDFVMPLFLFITGVTLPFSLNKWLKKGITKAELYKKAFWRMLILIAIGIIYKNVPLPIFEPSEIRLVSVLGRIGIAGFVTAVLSLNFSGTRRLVIAGSILVAYYAALFLIPVPGYGAGDLSIEGNLAGWFDRNFLPGRLLEGHYDELGLLTQLPALCLTIFGAAAGDLLYSSRKPWDKVKLLYLIGAAGIVAGLLWGMHFPINKKLWSSSFILLTGGMSFIFMGLFYMLIDVMRYQKWAFFFQVIGLNSLTIYLAYRFIGFRDTASMLFSGFYSPLPAEWHPLFEALGGLLLVWLFLYFLYRNRLFLKV